MAFKAISHTAPENMIGTFNLKTMKSTKCVGIDKLFLDRPNRSFMKKSFSYRGAYALNNHKQQTHAKTN